MNLLWYLALVIVSYVLSSALAPKSKPPEAPLIDDFKFPQAEEGTPQAVVFGDVWTEDWMVLSVGNYRIEEIHGEGGKK